ncbi:MAG: hypothetical protein SGARI_002153 [Bacillariaceae sp.]
MIPEKKEYEAAKYFDPEYVKNQRIGFLRSERFDAKAAAEKMVKHFEAKKRLFGDGEILARDIKYSDLSAEDIKNAESGMVQTLPFRDAAGRAILFVRPELEPSHDKMQKARAMFYILASTLRDEVARELHRVRETLPKKLVGLHFCSCNEEIKSTAAQTTMCLMNREMRLHFRPHFCETPKEVAFELQTYGIPITEEHLTDSTVAVDWHKEWLAIRHSQEQEASAESDKGVIIPRRFDVLFGRGKTTREHSGNLRCNLLIEMYADQYEQANKVQKTIIAERIVAMVHESLGRFLKQEANKGWVEVSDEAAREKISHFFRFQRSKRVSNGDTQDTDSAPNQASKRVTPCPSPSLSLQPESKRQVAI